MDIDTVAKQRTFEQAYMFAEPYNGFVNGCSVQTASFLEGMHTDLRLGRRPEDLCLYVFFRLNPPQDLNYPREFDGMPVVTMVVGEIHEEEPIYESREQE